MKKTTNDINIQFDLMKLLISLLRLKKNISENTIPKIKTGVTVKKVNGKKKCSKLNKKSAQAQPIQIENVAGMISCSCSANPAVAQTAFPHPKNATPRITYRDKVNTIDVN
jgi:hypothetical protein